MTKKMSNLTKDYIVVIAVCVVVIWVLSGAIYYIFGAETKLTDIEIANKFYCEEQVKEEMRYLAMRDYIENMSEEEFLQTFYKDEIECQLECQSVQKKDRK